MYPSLEAFPFEMTPEVLAYYRADVEAQEAARRSHDTVEEAKRALLGKVPADYPKEHPLRAAWEIASRKRDEINAIHRERRQLLARAVGSEGMRKYNAVWVAHYYRDKNPSHPVEHTSPSGCYRLLVTTHPTGPGTWEYSRGRVFSCESGAQIAEVRRNYGAFPFSWIEGHRNRHDYLLCGENYQGQTVIELDTGGRVDHMPESAAKGMAFCWVKHTPSSDGSLIAVEGCYWACSGEVVIVDFTSPMQPPWPELHRDEEFFGWISATSCTIGREFYVRRSDGKKDSDLTDEEELEMLRLEKTGRAHSDLWETRRESVVWTKPT